MGTVHLDGATVGDVYEVLSHPARRALVDALRGVGTTTLEAAADALVVAGEHRPGGSEQHGRRERAEVALHHNHLPRMAEAGLIDYDPGTGTIRTNDATRVAHELLYEIRR